MSDDICVIEQVKDRPVSVPVLVRNRGVDVPLEVELVVFAR
jgi:hypothetical protein